MNCRLSFVLASLFASCAFAQSGVATCVTTSAGKAFRASDAADVFAQQTVIANCQRDGATSNAECQRNVICDSGVYQPAICQTASAGLTFKAKDTFMAFAKVTAVADCQKSGATSNAECQRNVVCATPSSTPATCEAASAGKTFTSQDASVDLAKMGAVTACQKDGATSNSECQTSVVCDDGHGPIGACQTTSSALVFRATDLPLPLARLKAVTDCKKSGSTSNADCERNVVCAATSSPVPAPVPAPSGGVCVIRETQKVVSVDSFYSMASGLARASNNCLVARMVVGTAQAGRIYRADGGRLSKGNDLSNQEIVNTLAAAGLTDCSKLTCDLQ